MSNQPVDVVELLSSEWTCAITQLPMKDPVVTEDGYSYEKSAIKEWLYNSSKSPQTGLMLQSKRTVPNRALKAVIQKFTLFIQQLEINYVKDFGRLQQIIQNEINSKEVLIDRLGFLLLKQNGHSQQNMGSNQILSKVNTNESSISLKQIFSQAISSHNRLINGYIQIANPLLTQERQHNLNQKRMSLFKKHSLSFLGQKLSNLDDININIIQQKDNQNNSQPILSSPLLMSFEKQSLHLLQKINELHPFEYLLDTFKSQRQIKARYKKNEFTQLSTLQHQRVVLNMQKFIQYDWKHIKTINLMDCHLEDKDWILFVKNAFKFPNLRDIKIYSNNISSVKQGDLESFHSLQNILFYTYGGWSNPLSESSKLYLRNFKNNNSHVHVLYQE